MGEPVAPPYGPAYPERRWSAAAITGFVLAILGCTAPFGLLFGLIGLFTTAGGRRRGKGLAIAAIPIALLTGTGVGSFVYLTIEAGKKFYALMEEVKPILGAGSFDSDQAVAALQELVSEDFNAAVDAEEIGTWLQTVADKHGQLRDLVLRPTTETTPEGGAAFNFAGKFVNGEANIRVTFKPGFLDFQVDDIEVDGFSPRDVAAPPSAAPSLKDETGPGAAAHPAEGPDTSTPSEGGD